MSRKYKKYNHLDSGVVPDFNIQEEYEENNYEIIPEEIEESIVPGITEIIEKPSPKLEQKPIKLETTEYTHIKKAPFYIKKTKLSTLRYNNTMHQIYRQGFKYSK